MKDSEDRTRLKPKAQGADATQVRPQNSDTTHAGSQSADATQVRPQNADTTHVRSPRAEATEVRPQSSDPTYVRPQNAASQETVLSPSARGSEPVPARNPTVVVKPKSRSAAADVSSAAATPNIGVGDTLNQRFLLTQVLGSGGMGEVYAAQDMRRVEMGDDDTYVALKLLREEFRTHSKFMIALQRESKKVQQLSHPNIVTVYDFDRDGDAAYISMEYLHGKSLDRVIQPQGLPAKEALYIIDRMARGLAYAHQEGYVHADFKPANVFLTDERQVKVLDFGIAQAVTRDKAGYRNTAKIEHDDPTAYALTPNYASLEMLQGEQPLPSDDVYSLCCVAYELLSGKHPFTGPTGKKVTALEAQQQGLTVHPISGIPKPYQRAILKGLSFNRAERFVSAGKFLDATKPKVTRTQIALVLLFCSLSLLGYFGVDTWQEKKVPLLSSLDSRLSNSVEMIIEADTIFKDGDTDLAHRLYSQAWDSAGDSRTGSLKLDKLKRVIDHRMNRIADTLMDELANENIDEFNRQQIQIALEFIKNDSLGTRDKKIEQVLEKLNKQ